MSVQDTRFSARFPDMTASVFVGTGMQALGDYTPSQSVLNTGMMSDIGRAMVYGPSTQQNPYSKFMKSELQRGNASMTAVFKDIKSTAYNPLAPDSALFSANRPEMISNVIEKNLDRTVSVEINDRYMKMFAQTPEMIGDVQSAIMAQTTAAYLDDMYTASNEYFAGSTRGAKATQMVTLTNDITDSGFAVEMIEELYNASQKDLAWKSTLYNKSEYNTKADNGVSIIMSKDIEFKAYRKLYSETFHPDYLRVQADSGYVDAFPDSVAGKPQGAGKLLAIVADNRAFEIVPMPQAVITESFRNPARHSTAYFTSYAYGLGQNPMFGVKYIFAPGTS